MKKTLTALLIAGMTFGMPYAIAQTDAAQHKTLKKIAPAAKDEEDEAEPDVTASSAVEYHCAENNRVTIYTNAGDDKFIALRWKKRVHRMKRVDTETGANRFENKQYGLIWIGIPAKSMLLDSKKGQQLANECKNALQ